MKKQSRQEARRAAFAQIFQLDKHSDEMETMIGYMLEEDPQCNDNLGYITMVVNGVNEHKEEIENAISAHLKPGWTLPRISRVSAAAMKLAVFEMKYVDDVPPKVAINEAVELDKGYDEPDVVSFVNGVLGGFMRGEFGEAIDDAAGTCAAEAETSDVTE